MIKIKYDDKCGMLLIERDGKCIFEGNYWDFPNDPDGIASFLDDVGVDSELHTYTYEE